MGDKGNRRWQRAQRHELRWWKKYLSRKDSAEYHRWKEDYWKQLIARLPDGVMPDAGDTVLDLGCGPAGIFMALPKYRVVAIDPLLDDYKRDGLLQSEKFPWVEFITGNIEHLSDMKSPLVLCMNVLNHVEDLSASLKSLRAATSDNGHFVMTIDVHRNALLRTILRLIPIDRLHPHQHTLKEYVRLIEANGLGIVHSEPIWKRGPLGHWLVVASAVQK